VNLQGFSHDPPWFPGTITSSHRIFSTDLRAVPRSGKRLMPGLILAATVPTEPRDKMDPI